jgi:hypothetical protein
VRANSDDFSPWTSDYFCSLSIVLSNFLFIEREKKVTTNGRLEFTKWNVLDSRLMKE